MGYGGFLRSIAVVAALAMPSAAAADWQNTRWGMSEVQVRGLVKNLAPVPDAERAAERFKDGTTPAWKGKHAAGDLEFDAYFYFGGSPTGLTHVVLRYNQPRQCAAVMGALKARYGNPQEGKDDPIFSLWTWRTERDMIHLARVGAGERISECAIHYQPRTTDRTKGL
jgi:hypothetical protein